MTEKNSTQNTLVVAAIIGAIGGIFAACIGLIPTVLPMVRPTSTPPFIVITATSVPTDTPAIEMPSATASITDMPTSTATLLAPPTDTPTVIPTPANSSSELDDYVGIWTNIDADPSSRAVTLIPTRIEVSKTGDGTAEFSVCRSARRGEVYVLPNPALAVMSALGLETRDLVIPHLQNLRWAVIIQRSDDQMVATVQEYDTNNIFLDSDTFQLRKVSLISSVTMPRCEEPGSTP